MKVRPIISIITQVTRLESGSRISMECLLVWNWPVVHHFAKRKAALDTTANFVKAERLGDDDENDDEHHCTEECSWLGAKQNQARIHNCATRLAQIGYHTVVRRCTVARKQQRTADCALGVESGHKSCVGICNRPDLPDCAFSFAPSAPPFHNCSPALQHKEKPVLLLKISEKRHSLISCEYDPPPQNWCARQRPRPLCLFHLLLLQVLYDDGDADNDGKPKYPPAVKKRPPSFPSNSPSLPPEVSLLHHYQ